MGVTGYAAQPWSTRFVKLGDEAEAVYDAVLPLGPSDRYGWRRPNVSMRYMSPELRNTPDRYASQGMLVEVMGLGRDDVLKLKLDKLEAMQIWDRIQGLSIFIWHSARKEWALIPYLGLRRLAQKVIKRDGTKQFENDGHVYVPLPWFELTRVKGIQRGEYAGGSET